MDVSKKCSALRVQSRKGRSITSIHSAQLAPAGTIPRLAGAFSVHGSDEQIFGADEQVYGRGPSD